MKKTVAILLMLWMMLSICLVSCKGKDDPKTDTPPSNITENQTPQTPDTDDPDDDKGDKEDDDKGSGGGLQVGEDTDDSKWGDFIPYE